MRQVLAGFPKPDSVVNLIRNCKSQGSRQVAAIGRERELERMHEGSGEDVGGYKRGRVQSERAHKGVREAQGYANNQHGAQRGWSSGGIQLVLSRSRDPVAATAGGPAHPPRCNA